MPRKPVPCRPVPAYQCWAAYISAFFWGVLVWETSIEEESFWLLFKLTCVCTIVIWLFSILNNNSSIYDPYWVLAPPFLALAAKSTSGLDNFHSRQIAILLCFVSWSCRYHFFYPWAGWWTGLKHEDWRYEDMRSDSILPYWLNSLLGMHMFPTVLVFFAFAPACLVMLRSPADQPAWGSLWDYLGLFGALSAVVIQYFADEQMRIFRIGKMYKTGGTLHSGLWKFSRHPNYFGEALFWITMIPFSLSTGDAAAFPKLCYIGPIAMFFFFRFSSTLMDARSLKHRPGYKRVMDEVSCMVPWPRRRESAMIHQS